MRNDAIGLRAGALALLAAVLWGGNSVAIKMGLQGMPPAAMAGARFLLGGLTVWVAALLAGIPVRVPRARGRGLAGLALLFAVQIFLLNVGTHFTTAARSTVLINVYPFFTAFFAHLFVPGDRLSGARLAGLLLSFAGVGLLFAESLVLEESRYLWGDLIVVVSGVLLGLRQVVIKRLVQGLHPYQVLFWQAGLSLPLFAALSLVAESQAQYHFTAEVVLAVFYQGAVVAGLCFILLVFLLQHHSASRLAAYGFVTPVVGVLLSAALLGEALSEALLASMALVALGIGVANRGAART